MNESPTSPVTISGATRTAFGGLRPADLSIRIAEAIECGATAALAINTENIRDLTSGRPLMSAPLTAAATRVSALIGDLRAVEPADLLSEMVASLEQAAARLNEASALVNTLSGSAAVRAIQAAQVWLQSAAMDVRWEVELVQAALEFEVADENRRAKNLVSASRSWLMPIFRPAPDMPRDAGSISWPAVASIIGIAILMALLVAVFGGPKKADARALDGPPVQAVKVQPSKAYPKPRCPQAYRVALTVRTTAKSTADGRHHAAVWVQADNRRPVRDEHGVWQYARPLKVGFGVSDSKRVPVSGCLDPHRVDGVDGTPIYLILNDPVDDDRDADGRIRRGTVLVKFVEGRGWKQVSK